MKDPLVFILAGGEGVRLRPLTEHRSKPAVPFGGRYRLIDVAISNALKPKWDRVFAITQFLAPSLNQYISETYGSTVSILSPKDKLYKGTADCIAAHLSILEESASEHVVILSGDQLYSMDLEEMLMSAQLSGADLTIAALPINEQEAQRMGVMKINQEKRIIDFIEKPQSEALLKKFSLSRKEYTKIHPLNEHIFLGSMGIYIFKRKALVSLLKEGDGVDFGMHIIPKQLKIGNTFAYIFDGYWEDIGTIKSYYAANLKLLESTSLFSIFYSKDSTLLTTALYLPPARIEDCTLEKTIIADGCLIKAKEIRLSLIGLNTEIGEGSVLYGVVSLGSLKKDQKTLIGSNCFLEKVLIDENAVIEDGVHLSLHGEEYPNLDFGPLTIVDGIIVIKKGALIPKNFSLREERERLTA
jgi:glucose-1-phosphate adenylyltransferase